MVEPMTDTPVFTEFASRDVAADHIATLIEGALRAQLATFGQAGLLVSGGSTPAPIFERLAKTDLPWGDIVHVGLVDERWVEADDPRSNAGLVQRSLLTGYAATAEFIPMKTPAATPEEAVADIAEIYENFGSLGPVILLGMGPDGHTASWFPGATGLETAMDVQNTVPVAAIDATGAPVAGDMPHRMTITAWMLDGAALAILYITGEDKRAVLENRDANLPIHHAERLLGDRLKEVWAP